MVQMEDTFECKFCSKNLQSKEILLEHIRSLHESIKSDFDEPVFEKETNLRDLLMTVHKNAEVKYNCIQCGKDFKNKKLLSGKSTLF